MRIIIPFNGLGFYYISTIKEVLIKRLINIQIEKLPEGYYLATSEDIQYLVAQSCTINETIEIASETLLKNLLKLRKMREY